MKSYIPFDVARKAAKNAPDVTRYIHSTVILDRKFRIIAIGRNYWAGKTIPAEDDPNKVIRKTIHSEVHALSKVNIRRLSGAILINYSRTKVASNLSRPCPNCWQMLKKLGFSTVFYTVRSNLDKPLWREENF